MTKAEIKSIIIDLIDDQLAMGYGDNDTLTSEALTEITDGIAECLGDTVNPNGPCYPSTPR